MAVNKTSKPVKSKTTDKDVKPKRTYIKKAQIQPKDEKPYWNEERKSNALKLIFDCISSGQSLKSILDGRTRLEVPCYSTFMEWRAESIEVANNYACACEERELYLLDEIFNIADDTAGDHKILENGNEVMDAEFIARSRLKVDVRKWALAKMNPKKYGDKVDVTTDGEKLPAQNVLQNVPTELLLQMNEFIEKGKSKE